MRKCFVVTLAWLFPCILVAQQTLLPTSNTESSIHRREVVEGRLELLRQYLLMGGVDAPAALNREHLPELRSALRSWLSVAQNEEPRELEAAYSQNSQQQPASENYPKLKDRQAAILRSLHTSPAARIGRMVQFSEQLQELNRTLFAQAPVAGSKPQLVLNPEHYLVKHSLTLKFKELALSTSDLSSIYGAYSKISGLNQIPDCPGPEDDKLLKCFARTRNKDYFAKLASALTLNVSLSERNKFQQGFLFTTNSLPGQEFAWTGELNFDPSALFPTGTDWESAISTLMTIKRATKLSHRAFPINLADATRTDCIHLFGHNVAEATTNEVITCIDKLSGPHGKWWVAAALIPTFQFKKDSQFDFVKNGGIGNVLVASPFPEPTLNTVSFTFDLAKAIPSVKSRADSLKAMADVYAACHPSDGYQCGSEGTKIIPNRPNAEKEDIVDGYLRVAISPDLAADDRWFEKFRSEVEALVLKPLLANKN